MIYGPLEQVRLEPDHPRLEPILDPNVPNNGPNLGYIVMTGHHQSNLDQVTATRYVPNSTNAGNGKEPKDGQYK